MSMSANALQSHNAFGLLIALEAGRSLDDLAKRAGVSGTSLRNVVRQARAGELTRIPAAVGSTFDHRESPPIPVPQTSPEPTPKRTAPVERKPMTEAAYAGIGARPDLAWIAVDLIHIDKTYQREADEKSVARIVSDFRWDHFGAVVLAAHDGGRFTVTDGQHRVRAAQLHPEITHVPALVTALSGQAAEADNFLTINRSRRTVSPIEIYWAGLASGDAATIRVRDVLQRAGCTVCANAGDYKAGATMAVSAIARTIERSGELATVAALKTIRKAWPDDNKALRGTLITALARIHRTNERLDGERLVKVLSGKSYAEITAHAETFRKLSGGSADTVIARTIAELYNRGLSTNTIYFGEAA